MTVNMRQISLWQEILNAGKQQFLLIFWQLLVPEKIIDNKLRRLHMYLKRDEMPFQYILSLYCSVNTM